MCHHRHHHRTREREVAAPATPTGPVRVSDADRERVAELLRSHAAAGRLDADELGERLERTYAAKYGSDLQAVLAELPPEPEPTAAGRARARDEGHGSAFAAFPIALAVLIAVAAITSAWWLMWLIWPLAIALGPRRRYRYWRAGVG